MIPVIHVERQSIAQAYEESLLNLYHYGEKIKTQYDRKEDPLSIDATANITINYPLIDPMIHKAFPGGIEDLKEYVMELEGVKDHWIRDKRNSNDKRWEYTYHERMANWGYLSIKVDQINSIIEKLTKDPFTRQAQIVIWDNYQDHNVYDPPCLQSIWIRLNLCEGAYVANVNIRFRSNDAWKAFFMNCFGLTLFIKNNILNVLSKNHNRSIIFGRLNWQADSFHIYGKDIKEMETRLIKKIGLTSFDDRIINFYDSDIQSYYNESADKVIQKVKQYDENH